MTAMTAVAVGYFVAVSGVNQRVKFTIISSLRHGMMFWFFSFMVYLYKV